MSQFFPPIPSLNYATPTSIPPLRSPNRSRNFFLGWLVFIVLAVMLVMVFTNTKKAGTELAISEFYDHLQAGDLKSVTVGSDSVAGVFQSPVTLPGSAQPVQFFQTSLPAGTTANWAFMSWLLENRHGARINVTNDSNILTQIVIPLIPWFLIFGFVWFVLARATRLTKARTLSAQAPSGPIEVIIVNREAK